MTTCVALDDGRPSLFRQDTDLAGLTRRCEWINAAKGTAVVGPSRIEEQTLIRPFVAGRPLDQLSSNEREQALTETIRTVAELHTRGLVHLGLSERVILGSNGTVFLLEGELSRSRQDDSDEHEDVLALGSLIERHCSPESLLGAQWQKLRASEGTEPLKASDIVRSITPVQPVSLSGESPSQLLKMGAALGAAVLLLLSMRSMQSGSSEKLTSETAGVESGFPDEASTEEAFRNETSTGTAVDPQPARPLWTAATSTIQNCALEECAVSATWEDGILTVGNEQFRLGAPGDQFFYGAWDCAAVASPALFTQAGSLYVFTDWDLPAVRTDVNPGSLIELVTDGGCDGLLVTSEDGHTTRYPTSS